MTTDNQSEAQPDSQADLVQEPEGEGWPFTELYNAAIEGATQLRKLPHLNPQSLRDFLVVDIYAIVADVIGGVDHYLADLNSRLLDLEEGQEEEIVEFVDPEFLMVLLEYVGRTIHIAPKVNEWASEKKDKEVLENMQVLMASAPAVVARLQELFKASQEIEQGIEEYEDEDEDDEEGEEEPEVVEPSRPVKAAEGTEEETSVEKPEEQQALVEGTEEAEEQETSVEKPEEQQGEASEPAPAEQPSESAADEAKPEAETETKPEAENA